MKKALFDINVILDILFMREGHYKPSADAVAAAKRAGVSAYIPAASFNIISYVATKELGRLKTLQAMEKIRLMFDIAIVDERVIDSAISSDFRDFEDAVQYYSAVEAKADCVVTRNIKDFKHASIPILSPEMFVKALEL